MTIPHVASTERNWTIHRHSPVLGWLGGVIARWGKWRDLRAARMLLDELSEGQLEEIGMRRGGRRARWLDCRESTLVIDFEYRGVPDDRRFERGSHV